MNSMYILPSVDIPFSIACFNINRQCPPEKGAGRGEKCDTEWWNAGSWNCRVEVPGHDT